MTGDQRPDGELLASLPRQPELMGVLYERHAPAVFRYLARRAGPAAAEDLLSGVACSSPRPWPQPPPWSREPRSPCFPATRPTATQGGGRTAGRLAERGLL